MRIGRTAVLLTLTVCATALAQQGPRRGNPFERFDKNGDGFLTADEMPPQAAERNMKRMDADGDGRVDPKEFEDFQARMQRQRERRQEQLARIPEPDLADVSYGPHERNVFDLWKAESDEPTPLVIYIHGGGFRGGDKQTIRLDLLEGLLEAGITVAATNYRLTNVAPYPAQMHDCARVVQFLRAHAAEYNIDPQRIGATGGSAGAGISQWLLFHDDLADPDAEDPVARESTVIQCAVVFAAQTSYDPRLHKKMFNTDQVEPALVALFGLPSPEAVNDPKFHPLFEDSSPINHLDKDDGPVMLIYPQRNEDLGPNPPGNRFIHHPKFGLMLKEKADELGVECTVKLTENYRDFQADSAKDTLEFFTRHLKQ